MAGLEQPTEAGDAGLQKSDEAVAAQGIGTRPKQPCDHAAANSAPVSNGVGCSITDVDFSIRVQAYEQAPSLQKFDFQPMKISFEFVEEKQFTEVLYPQGMYCG